MKECTGELYKTSVFNLLLDLPNDVLRMILQFLDFNDLHSCRLTSKVLDSFVQQEQLRLRRKWMYHIMSRYHRFNRPGSRPSPIQLKIDNIREFCMQIKFLEDDAVPELDVNRYYSKLFAHPNCLPRSRACEECHRHKAYLSLLRKQVQTKHIGPCMREPTPYLCQNPSKEVARHIYYLCRQFKFSCMKLEQPAYEDIENFLAFYQTLAVSQHRLTEYDRIERLELRDFIDRPAFAPAQFDLLPQFIRVLSPRMVYLSLESEDESYLMELAFAGQAEITEDLLSPTTLENVTKFVIRGVGTYTQRVEMYLSAFAPFRVTSESLIRLGNGSHPIFLFILIPNTFTFEDLKAYVEATGLTSQLALFIRLDIFSEAILDEVYDLLSSHGLSFKFVLNSQISYFYQEINHLLVAKDLFWLQVLQGRIPEVFPE